MTMQDACRDSYFRSRVKKAESSEMASIGEVSEDSILLQETVIRGHHVFKEIWTSLIPRPSLTAFFAAVAKSVVATAAKKAVREGMGTRLDMDSTT